ncbi:MAG: MoaD/ThiS family protein [Bacteroidales bacterium]|nr:MoaD/ThiS family protein [Bacteroidales bacterium]
MNIKVLFFGVLADETGNDTIEIKYEGSLEGFRRTMEERFPSISRYSYRLSVNRVLEPGNTVLLKDGDEVAFMPPFAGG